MKDPLQFWLFSSVAMQFFSLYIVLYDINVSISKCCWNSSQTSANNIGVLIPGYYILHTVSSLSQNNSIKQWQNFENKSKLMHKINMNLSFCCALGEMLGALDCRKAKILFSIASLKMLFVVRYPDWKKMCIMVFGYCECDVQCSMFFTRCPV